MEQSEHLLQALRTEPVGSDEFTKAVQTLAIQSRESPEIRHQLAKTIPRLLQVTEKPDDVADEVLTTTLRCIGNACVDNQEACQDFLEADFDLTNLINLLEHRRLELRDLTMKLLYNICSQSEAAQKKCFEASVHASIVSSLFEEAKSDTNDSDSSPSLAIDLLFWITSQSRERDAASKSLREGLGEPGIKKLLDLPSMLAETLDTEDFATLLEISLVFLRDQEIQDYAAKERLVGTIWRTLEINEGKVHEVEGDADDHKLLVALCTSLTWILSDVAASESFATMEDIENSTFLARLLSLLASSEGPPSATPVDIPNGDLRLTIAACQVIGNYLHGKGADAAVPLVKDRRIHQRLFECMVASDNADFLHSAAGLLIQLSRPSPQIREELTSDGNAIAATERLGKHTVQQLNQDALMLMRALGKETPSVQERFKPLAGEVMASVAEAQQAATDAQAAQPSLPGIE